MEPNPQQENPAEQTVQTEGQPEKAPEAGATAGTEGTAGTEETGAAAGTETAEEAPVQPVEEEEEKPLGRADRSLMFFFWPLVVTALYVPVGLIWMCFRFMAYKSQLLLLTNKRLVLFKGVFKKKQYMISLDMAAHMTMEQGFLGRKAGYGTLVIGQGKEAIRYDYVRDPEKFMKMCKEAAQ